MLVSRPLELWAALWGVEEAVVLGVIGVLDRGSQQQELTGAVYGLSRTWCLDAGRFSRSL
jgi:hypothetical protein